MVHYSYRSKVIVEVDDARDLSRGHDKPGG